MRHFSFAAALLIASTGGLAQPAPPTLASAVGKVRPTAADVAAVESIGGGTAAVPPVAPAGSADRAAAVSIGGGTPTRAPGTVTPGMVTPDMVTDAPTTPAATGDTPDHDAKPAGSTTAAPKY